MALDLGLTTYQLLSALDGVAPNIQSRRRRLDDAIDRALAVPAGGAAFRTAAVGRRPYIAARTGPEGLLGSQPPPQVPQDWTALSVDGSHIDVDRHLPLRCHLVNLGGCAITYGQNHGCQLFSEPTLAVDDEDLYLRSPDDARGETLISGPLLGALRTVREVERLADAVENLPDDRPVLALLDGTLAFWDLQRGNYPRYVADVLIAERLQPALARLRAASTDRRPVAVAAYTSRPRTTEVAGALRLMLCEQADADCNRLCTARRSELEPCDGAAGFDDRETVRAAAGTGTSFAPVPVQPPGGPLRPGIGHRPGVEPLLLPQRRRRDRSRRGPRLAGRGSRAFGAQPRHAGQTVPAGYGLSGGHLRGPRAGRHHRPRPGGVPPPDPHAPGTAGPAHSGVRQGHIQA